MVYQAYLQSLKNEGNSQASISKEDFETIKTLVPTISKFKGVTKQILQSGEDALTRLFASKEHLLKIEELIVGRLSKVNRQSNLSTLVDNYIKHVYDAMNLEEIDKALEIAMKALKISEKLSSDQNQLNELISWSNQFDNVLIYFPNVKREINQIISENESQNSVNNIPALNELESLLDLKARFERFNHHLKDALRVFHKSASDWRSKALIEQIEYFTKIADELKNDISVFDLRNGFESLAKYYSDIHLSMVKYKASLEKMEGVNIAKVDLLFNRLMIYLNQTLD